MTVSDTSPPPVGLPASICGWTAGARWVATDGHSGATTFRIERQNAAPLFLKLTLGETPGMPLAMEAAVLRWLDGRLPVPKVVAFDALEAREFLLMSEVPGYPAFDSRCPLDRREAVTALAAGLQRLHEVSIDDCPFDRRLAWRLERAVARTGAGLVDEDDFEPRYQGTTAAELLPLLHQKRPDSEDVVFTHGDYCLPNVLLDERGVTGFIDLGGAGTACRYHDLALAYRSIRHNFGEGPWGDMFLSAYGLKKPDWDRIHFYILLDEFF